MNTKFSKYFKLTFALLLFLQVGKVSAQTNCTVSGVTINTTGTDSDFYVVPTYSGCTFTSFTGAASWTGNVGTAGTVTYTFSTPIVSANITYNAVDAGAATTRDVGTLSVNGGGILTLSNLCNVTATGSVISGISTGSGTGNVSLTVSSTIPFTTITITNTGGKTGWVQGNPCDFSFSLPCLAASTAPTLSATSKTNLCPANTVNLNSLVTSATPAGTTLKWFTNSTHTSIVVADATQAPAGTYYAFYYDSSNNCYSPSSAAVTSIVTACCPTAAPTIN